MVNIEVLEEIRNTLNDTEKIKVALDELISNQFSWDLLTSPTDAEKKYNISSNTIRQAIFQGRLKEGIDCKKFGKQWVIKVEALEKLFNSKGEFKNEKK